MLLITRVIHLKKRHIEVRAFILYYKETVAYKYLADPAEVRGFFMNIFVLQSLGNLFANSLHSFFFKTNSAKRVWDIYLIFKQYVTSKISNKFKSCDWLKNHGNQKWGISNGCTFPSCGDSLGRVSY